MAFPTIFANLAAGLQPASLLDQMFNICGGMGNIPTTATGVNAVSLTPVTNFYQPANYANFQMVTWKQPAALTGACTIQLGSLPFVKLFMPSGLQANSGDLAANVKVTAIFAADLDAGNGGFQVLNATTPSVVQPVMGTAKNLTIVNDVSSPDTKILINFDELILENAATGTLKSGGFGFPQAVTITTTGSGANGLDTGTLAAAQWYSVWVIFNFTSGIQAGLISLQTTSPVMPAGFTYRARVGWVRTGPASTNLCRTFQRSRVASYTVVPGSQTPNLPIAAAGATVGAVSLSNFVPPTAAEVDLVLGGHNGGGAIEDSVAPNANYLSMGSTTNPPPAGYQLNNVATTGAAAIDIPIRMMLEGSQFFRTPGGAGVANTLVAVRGWTDNL